MKKTAMQEMWDGLNNTHPSQWNKLLLHDKDRLLEKEKDQIIDAYKKGNKDMADSKETWAVDYYNETFKP